MPTDIKQLNSLLYSNVAGKQIESIKKDLFVNVTKFSRYPCPYSGGIGYLGIVYGGPTF